MKARIILLAVTCSAVTCLPFIVSSADNPAQAGARAAISQNMAKMETRASTPSPTVAKETDVGPRADTEAQALARQAVRQGVVMLAAMDQGYGREQTVGELAAGPCEDNEAQARARQAVRGNAGAPVAVVTVVEEKPVPTTPTARNRSSNRLLHGVKTPESPFTAEQQAALAALLEPYMANAISTKEYHQKRAAIIAGT